MCIGSGALALTRYRARWDGPSLELLGLSLRGRRFRSIAEGTEALAVGWVPPLDPLGAGPEVELALDAEPWLVLCVRIDRKRVKGAVLRERLRAEIAAARAAGAEGITRDQREELRERARLKLLRILPPEPTLVPVAWERTRGELWIFSRQAGLLDLVGGLVSETFAVKPVPIAPWDMVLAWGLGAGVASGRLEDLRPINLYRAER